MGQGVKTHASLFLGAMLLGAATLPAVAQEEIVVWVVGEPGEPVVYEDIAAAYNSAHPETHFEVVKQSTLLFNPALIPALSSGEGPDLFMFGTGPGQPAAMIAGGLVADLSPYYWKYGWDKVIPPTVVDVTSSDGKLWAIGFGVETTGLFYNKAIFEKHGLGVPSTWSEFVALVASLKDAGYSTPIGLGGADAWPISHWQSMMFGRYAGPEGLSSVMFGDGHWNEEPYLRAATRLKEMADAGFFGPNPVAEGDAEIMERFWAGELPMVFTGPWAIPGGLNAAGDRIGDYGVFQVPAFEDDQLVYPTYGIGSGWYIRANSSQIDKIAAFVDHMLFNHEGRVAILNSGVIPVGPLEDELKHANMPQIAADLASLADQHAANGKIHAFLDTVTPASMTTASYDGLQALLLGQITPEQFVDDIEAAWQDAKSQGAILRPGGVIN